MKSSLPCIGLAVGLLLAAPATAGTIQFDYQGCGQPVTLTIDDANLVTVWRQLASEAGFAVRAGPSTPDTKVNFSMSGSLHEVLAALARYTGAVLVAANDTSCLGSRQARTVWLMSEGTAVASTLMAEVESASVSETPVSEPPVQDANAGDAREVSVSLTAPQRRGQLTPAERFAERERRRRARRERR